MMNPWLILAVVLAIGAAGGSGYLYGKHVQSAEDKAAQLTAINQAVDTANKQAKADLDAAVIAADRAAKAKTRTITIRGQAIETIREVPSPAQCDWDDRSFAVLRDAIDASNDQPATTSSMPQPLPSVGTAGKPKR